MNRPSTLGGNWSWRFREEALAGDAAERLATLARLYGRAADGGGRAMGG